MFIVTLYAHQSYLQGENKDYESFQSLPCFYLSWRLEEEWRIPCDRWRRGCKSRLHAWKILVGFPVDLGKWKSTLFIAIFRYFVFILQPSMQHPIPISGRTRKQLWTTSLVEHSVTSIWWGLVLCFSEGSWELWWRWWSGANAVRTRTYIWQAVFSPSFLHSSVLHSVVC